VWHHAGAMSRDACPRTASYALLISRTGKFLLGAFVALFGSGAAGAAHASSAPNSCTVITRSQAGAALREKVKPPVRGRAAVEGGVACVFYGPHAPKGASADVPVTDSVRVVLVRGAKARVYFDDYRSKVHAQPISGLGEKAYYDGYASLSVLKGHYYVRIAVIGVKNVLAAEKKLASDALHRL
jgi:hypothetical protein